MRYALFSDVHANLAALEAVLADIDRTGVDEILCLGDVVGYGASPQACLTLARARCRHFVLGNHDAMAALDVQLDPLRDDVAAGLRLARAQLSTAERAFLRRLPLVHHFGGFAVTHASLEDPLTFEYIDGATRAAAHLARQVERVGFVGHTHVPAIYLQQGTKRARRVHPRGATFRLHRQGRYVVNVGSVGQPRDRDPRACWVLFDDRAGTIRWQRVRYDIQKSALAALEADLPEVSAARLFMGR